MPQKLKQSGRRQVNRRYPSMDAMSCPVPSVAEDGKKCTLDISDYSRDREDEAKDEDNIQDGIVSYSFFDDSIHHRMRQSARMDRIEKLCGRYVL